MHQNKSQLKNLIYFDNKKKKKILILQGQLPEYRIPIFNKMSDFYDLTILHTSHNFLNNIRKFKEITCNSIKIGPFYFIQIKNLFSLLKRFDVIISMFDLRWPQFLIPLLLPKRPRFILWGHRKSKHKLIDAIRKYLLSHSDAIILYGSEDISDIISYGIDYNKIHIAFNTVHVQDSIDHSKEFKSSILFVGRLQKRKNIDILIKSFASIQSIIPEYYTLDIVGDGLITEKLKSLCDSLGILCKTNFHGEIRDNFILSNLFKKAVCYASPGAVGLGVLHSFAYGVPVITFRDMPHGPEFHNLTNDFNSIIVENSTNFSQALFNVCTNYNFASFLGNNAYSYYTNNRTIEIMLNGFHKSINT